MSDLQLPDGQPVEIEFTNPVKAAQRGILPEPLEDDATKRLGFWFYEIRVPENLAFGEPFRVETIRKWLNLSTVAEVRQLSEGALRADLDRRQALHEEVRKRLEQGG